jgi:hypothetical protein
LISAAACKRTPEKENVPLGTPQQTEQESTANLDPQPVEFLTTSLPNRNGSTAMLASYVSQGKIARFRIELGPGKKDESNDREPGEPSVTIGTGRFVAEPGSNASILLGDLKKALLAKSLPSNVQRVPSVPFTFVSFGDRLSPAPGGGMHANPPGKWTVLKLFLGEGQNESQVFLYLDPTEGKGQFSIKDADYGDLLLIQFAKVF